MGQVLSDDVFSPIPLPPFKSSAMDGFALRLSDWDDSEDKTFNIAGVSLAGHQEIQAGLSTVNAFVFLRELKFLTNVIK